MNKEILLVVDAVSNERGVDKELIFEALESALAIAVRKRQGNDKHWGDKRANDMDIRVAIDRTNGDYKTYRRWQVVTETEKDSKSHISLEEALAKNPQAQLGGYVEEVMSSAVFDRIAAQTAKQVIVQKIREAERSKVLSAYQNRKGELVTGVVRRIDRGNVIVDLGGNVEAILPKEHTIERESIRPGDRLRGYLYDVRTEPGKGPQLFISRTADEFLIELFKLEVPEVGEGLIKIIGAAREPGIRSKIAVQALESRIEPIGACVGMRGSRVQAIMNELNGERVDIIPWDENIAQFVLNAMAPAEVVSIVVDEEVGKVDIAVKEDKRSQAIGRNGQNVHLASKLTGWELNVMNESEAVAKSETESRVLVDFFRVNLHADEEVASRLVEEGFTSLDEVAYVPVTEMLEIEQFDEPLVEKLRQNAKDALLTKAIAKEEVSGIAPDLLALEGMDNTLAIDLAARGWVTLEDLAEQSVDELMVIEGMDEQRAAVLIMKAREPWFAEVQKK